jgi:hypothetical protein
MSFGNDSNRSKRRRAETCSAPGLKDETDHSSHPFRPYRPGASPETEGQRRMVRAWRAGQ